MAMTYETLSRLFAPQAMAAEGLCELSIPKSGEPTVSAIRRDAAAYRTFECWERTAEDAEIEATSGGRGPPLSLTQLYRPREPQKSIFAACGETDRKAFYSLEEATALLERYVASECGGVPGNNGDKVTLDPTLTDALFKGEDRPEGVPLPTHLQWHALKQRWGARLEVWTRIAGGGLEKPKLCAGKTPPPIVVTTQQRRGHSVTLVDQLATYGIDPQALAQELQTAFGASSGVEDGKTVMLQGLWDRSVGEHITSTHGLPAVCIDNKAAGKAGMSQKKDKKATNIRTK